MTSQQEQRLLLLDKQVKACETASKRHLRRHIRNRRVATVCRAIVHVSNAAALTSIVLSYGSAVTALRLATAISTSLSTLLSAALSVLDLEHKIARDITTANQLADLARETRQRLLENGMTIPEYARLHASFNNKLSLVNDSADALDGGESPTP